MKVTGNKRWLVLGLCCILSGIMVYVPFLRYSYMEQMIVIFTEYKPIVSPDHAYEFLGDIGAAYGTITMITYLFGGLIADKFREKNLLLAGSILMGLSSIWYGTVPVKTGLILIHVFYAIGTGILIWSAFLKVTRKMGTSKEQGRMFSISEMARSILNMLIGFLGVAMLGRAVIGDGSMDPQVLGTQWRNLMFLFGVLHILVGFVVFFILPKDIIGNEEESEQVVQEKLSVHTVLEVLRQPGVWLVSILIFFCFSFYCAASGYLGSYTTNVLGVSTSTASNYSVVRTYLITALSTLAIGFIADRIGSKVKTLGIYLVLATAVTGLMVLSEGNTAICVGTTFIFAIFYTGMRGLYFATMGEVGIPLRLTGTATGIISVICYLPDVFFAKLAGFWIDTYGNQGYDLIWYWCIGCGVLGIITAFITMKYIRGLKKGK